MGELSIWQEALKVKCQGLASLTPLGVAAKKCYRSVTLR